MMYFYPYCFARVLEDDRICPYCCQDIQEWEQKKTYATRLVQALRHPIDEVRMGAIISLGNQADPHTATALVECAYRFPTMVPQNLQILASLLQFPSSPERDIAFNLLSKHPSRMIAKRAIEMLDDPSYERANANDAP